MRKKEYVSRESPTQTGHRLFFKSTAWMIYGIACGCHFFRLKYDEKTNRVEETRYNRVLSKIVVAIKLLLLASQYMIYFVMAVGIYIHVRLVDSSHAQHFLMGVFMQGIGINVLRRLVIFLHLKQDRRYVRHAVNEILYITRMIERSFGMIYSCDAVLLGVYLCKLWMLYILLDSLWDKSYFLLLSLLYWVLLEYCFLGYFVYQLHLLNWYRSITRFLQRFIEDHGERQDIAGRHHRHLSLLFKLHLRINNLHKFVIRSLSWLPNSIYLMIFTCIFNMELLIECSLFAEDELENKIYIIADGCLGPVLIPILYVLILGMCTDRLRDAELVLQQQIVIIHGLYMRQTHPRLLAGMVLDNEHTSLILHQKLKPLQNVMLLDNICDREFAFDYILTVILTALSLVQYTISCGEPLNESCIIGPELSVKVCSIGTVINRSAYASDYCQLEGTTGRQTQPMPIRWMAWESVLMGKFTTKSDVWSFAVALWEILTFAREQPYEHMTDENVIENIGHIYQDDAMHEFLPMPLNCPREIYDLMCECWQRNESSRPNFREIHLFLQRKNLGFKPQNQTLLY